MNVLQRVGVGAVNVAKNAPLLSTALTVGSAALAVKDREDLSTKDKATHVAATSGGALAGMATGAAIGTAIPIPVVGTVVGATAGLILSYFGGKYGSKFGDFITSKETKEKGIISSVRESVGVAFKSSKSTINSVFDDAIKDGAKNVEIPVTIAQGRSIVVTTAAGEVIEQTQAETQTQNTQQTEINSEAQVLKTMPVPFDLNDPVEKRIAQYNSIIEEKSKKYNVSPDLARAVIRQESKGDANATSYAGAQGLMQLMPATAKDLGVVDAYDPAQNIEGGIKYLAQHINYFKKQGFDEEGATKAALASYNAGRGWVNSARKQTNNSLDADVVLQKLADPQMVRTAGGSPRAISNINQTDNYFKTIMGDYAYRLANIKTAPAKIPQNRTELMKAKTEAITATANTVTPINETVSSIDAKTQSITPAPQKVIVTNPPKAETKTVSIGGKNSAKQNSSTTINNVKAVNGGVTIPSDFDDQNLRLIALDLN